MRYSTYLLFISALLRAQDVPLIVYENGDFDGIYRKLELGEVALMETWEDRISSLRISEGYQAKIYEHAQFKGKWVILSSDQANLKKINFNDIISSIKVEKYNKDSHAGYAYDNGDYDGNMFPLALGNYNNLNEQSWLNDKISSITIAKGYQIKVYEHGDFKGKSELIKESQANLKTLGWNDKISSLKVERNLSYVDISSLSDSPDGIITIYKDSNFKGDHTGFDLEEVSSLNKWNDEISSLKISTGYQVTVYEHGDFKGKNVTITQGKANLVPLMWNDKISSLKVEKYNRDADAVTAYADGDYSGSVLPLKIGKYRDLNKESWLNNKISSFKVSEGYKVTIYDKSNFDGNQAIIINNTPSLRQINFNDKISSLAVTLNPPGSYDPDSLKKAAQKRISMLKNGLEGKIDSIRQVFDTLYEQHGEENVYDNNKFIWGSKDMGGKKKYIGQFKYGLFHGIGKIIDKKIEYIGEFTYGKADGFGHLIEKDKMNFKGYAKEKDGDIRLVYGSGNSIEGDNTVSGTFVDDMPSGDITLLHKSGASFTGIYDAKLDFFISGKGKLIIGDQELSGEFIDGQGLMLLKDNKQKIYYYGELLMTKNGELNGYGIGSKQKGIIRGVDHGLYRNGKRVKALRFYTVARRLKEKYPNFDLNILQSVLPDTYIISPDSLSTKE